jgi:hypothetical protein
VCGPSEFSAPPAPPDAFPGWSAAGFRQPSSGFLGKAVGSIQDPDTIKFWKKTFTKDVYVKNILREGYKIPVKMSPEEGSTIYRERNNKSARSEMDFVHSEVKRLRRTIIFIYGKLRAHYRRETISSSALLDLATW